MGAPGHLPSLPCHKPGPAYHYRRGHNYIPAHIIIIILQIGLHEWCTLHVLAQCAYATSAEKNTRALRYHSRSVRNALPRRMCAKRL